MNDAIDDLAKMIATAKRIAESHALSMLVYLLSLAEAELTAPKESGDKLSPEQMKPFDRAAENDN